MREPCLPAPARASTLEEAQVIYRPQSDMITVILKRNGFAVGCFRLDAQTSAELGAALTLAASDAAPARLMS